MKVRCFFGSCNQRSNTNGKTRLEDKIRNACMLVTIDVKNAFNYIRCTTIVVNLEGIGLFKEDY